MAVTLDESFHLIVEVENHERYLCCPKSSKIHVFLQRQRTDTTIVFNDKGQTPPLSSTTKGGVSGFATKDTSLCDES